MKIIDLGWFWRSLSTSMVGYFSDSWASCSLVGLHEKLYIIESAEVFQGSLTWHNIKMISFW